MITFGQGLYNLTERDRSTLFVDSFFRLVAGNVPATFNSGTIGLAIPLDRVLFISNFSVTAFGTALSTTTQIALNAISDSGVSYRLFSAQSDALLGDNASSTGPGVAVTIGRTLQLLVPPACRTLSLSVNRTGNTNAASFQLAVAGYLLPPGGIGRLA